MNKEEQLSEYLRTRNVYLDDFPLWDVTASVENIILHDTEKLAKVAGLSNFKGALQDVIRVRCLKLQRILVMSAVPEEVVVLRQAIVELSKVLEDIDMYRKEYERRVPQKQ